MDSQPGKFLSVLKWPIVVAALAAALAAALVAFVPARNPAPVTMASVQDATPPRVDMREAMRMLNEEHDRVLDQASRQRAETEQQAAENTYAFEQARVAAVQEAARKLAEQRAAEQRAIEQRAAEQRVADQRNAEKRLADASIARDRKPKVEPEAVGAPLDIAPAGESGPLVAQPRGPIESVVAKVGDIAGEIKNKTVATVTGIKDWFSNAGDKLLGR